MEIDNQILLFLIGTFIAIINSLIGFAVWRFSYAVDRLTETVGELKTIYSGMQAIISEHGRRLDVHDEHFQRIDERCSKRLESMGLINRKQT